MTGPYLQAPVDKRPSVLSIAQGTRRGPSAPGPPRRQLVLSRMEASSTVRRAVRGGVPEWSNGAVSKTVVPYGYRGFESHSLRHYF